MAKKAVAGRAWRALRDPHARLALARDPSATSDELATIAPRAQDRDTEVELVLAVLGHPQCHVGVAGRYASWTNSEVLRRVVEFPGLPTSSLEIMAAGPESDAQREAQRRLTNTTSSEDC